MTTVVQQLDNNVRGRLDGSMNKTWDDWGKVRTFLSWKRASDYVVIATDSDTITKHVKDIEAYLITLKEAKPVVVEEAEDVEMEILPNEAQPTGKPENGVIEINNKAAIENTPAVVATDDLNLRTMNVSAQMTIADGLRNMFLELSEAKSPERIKSLSLKATNMVKITNAMTSVARLELDIVKTSLANDLNKNRKKSNKS